jgi:nucleotide-binding universal stress UspA family protein
MQTWKGGSPAPDWLDERVQDTGSGRRGSTGVILLTLFHATGSGNLVVGRLTHLHFQEVSMAIEFKPGWSKPSKILFASELPHNEQAFSFAVAQAAEYGAKLILFHAYDTLVVSATETKGLLYYDFGAAAKAEAKHLAPLAERVRAAGVECETVVKPGLAADQILTYMREEKIDRIVMGTHCPGPIGKLLVGSVAEAVLRTASAPVFVVGPEVAESGFSNFSIRTILCGVSLYEPSSMVPAFAAELAARHHARLVMQHVIRPQERQQVMAGRSISQIEDEVLATIPPELEGKFAVQPVVTPGDPTEELLYQARAQQADLIVLGAQGASAFAAVARHGVVYKVLAHAHCPVLTLSPVVLAMHGARKPRAHQDEVYLAGVF